ncbi:MULTISPECIES: AbrB/MazE/SpoVT family DNA-binding domain-containing protein [unclassified Acinetobacter]|jgi:antitoxin MazE|uniref:AbrB/MazE/SpoVT family DNA-binding domain-containing protein n=1 Tax=unclassified Acinetobacter TaxID=196816 RepID=UPI000BCBFFFB|nr:MULTISPECIES: AbrB/MazE/SpoVT family DNA-binding domain-containing protein [unclassified Acinetobacter]PCN59293.1 PbsX family transcriptional regulator [Acinetobacter sp. YT-02]
MELTIKRWGNSAALRLPADLLNGLNLKPESIVEVSMKNKSIVIKPIKKKSDLSLEKLLAGITSENLHNEVDTGYSVGKEIF